MSKPLQRVVVPSTFARVHLLAPKDHALGPFTLCGYWGGNAEPPEEHKREITGDCKTCKRHAKKAAR